MRIFKEDLLVEHEQFAASSSISNVNVPASMVEQHWHDYYEVLYIMDGSARQFIDGAESTVSQGDIVIIQPGETHKTIAVSENGCGIVVLLFFPSCLNYDNHLNHYSRYLNLFQNSLKSDSRYLHAPYPYDQEVKQLTSRINEEFTLKPAGYELVCKGCLYQLLGLLRRNGGLCLEGQNNSDQYDKIVEICRYMEVHYDQPLTLEDAARRAGYTKTYFSALFRETVGETFKNFLDYIRITEALRLLSGGMSVGETAAKTGFGSIYSFSRMFKRLKGYAPSEVIYRKNC